MAGLPQAAGCVKMTSGRFCLVPLVGQPVFVSSSVAENHLCLLGLGKGLGNRQRTFGACPGFLLHMGC